MKLGEHIENVLLTAFVAAVILIIGAFASDLFGETSQVDRHLQYGRTAACQTTWVYNHERTTYGCSSLYEAVDDIDRRLKLLEHHTSCRLP